MVCIASQRSVPFELNAKLNFAIMAKFKEKDKTPVSDVSA